MRRPQLHPLLRKAAVGHTRRYRESPRYRGGSWAAIGMLLVATYPAATTVQEYRVAKRGESNFVIVAPEQVGVDRTFTAELHVKTGLQAINAVSGIIEFNPRRLEIVTMTTAQSFCSFYTQNSFDNIKGRVEISCGSPNPGFRGDSTLLLINMRARSAGDTELKMIDDEARILANDGLGTNLLGELPSATILVRNEL